MFQSLWFPDLLLSARTSIQPFVSVVPFPYSFPFRLLLMLLGSVLVWNYTRHRRFGRHYLDHVMPERKAAIAGGDSSVMTISQLKAAFGDPIVRMALNWDLLEEVSAPVTVRVFTERSQLDWLIHPWFTDNQGMVVEWAGVDSSFFVNHKPLTVLEAAITPEGLFPETLTRIEKIRTELGAFATPIQVTALGYELPNGKQLLLDCNHRIATLAQMDIPFRLMVMSIAGPMDPSILPDLTHWLP